jgi:hypothetical protein
MSERTVHLYRTEMMMFTTWKKKKKKKTLTSFAL